jgi:glucoamylase
VDRGRALRVCLPEPALVHYGVDGWQRVADLPTRDGGLGVHFADLEAAKLGAAQRIDMTFHWKAAGSWEGRDYRVEIGGADPLE